MRGRARLALFGALGTGGALLVAWACTGPSGGRASAPASPSSVGHASVSAWAIGSRPARATVAASDGGVVDDEERTCLPVRVTDWARRPVDDALVTLGRIDEGGAPTVEVEGRTDAEGLVLLCARGDADAEIDAWDDEGQWAHASVWWSADSLEEEEVLLHLAPPTVVRGRVTSTEGEPIAGAELSVETYEPSVGGEAVIGWSSYDASVTGAEAWRTDDDGSFEIPIAVPGVYQLRAEAPGFVPGAAGPVMARMEGDAHLDVALVPGRRLTAVVIAEGRPVRGALVRLSSAMRMPQTILTDGMGRAELRDVAAEERIDLEVIAEGYPERYLSLMEGEHEIELSRPATVIVHPRLDPVLEACRESIGGVAFQLRGADGWQRGGTLQLDDDHVIANVPPGEATLVVETEFFVAEQQITLRSGEERRADVDVRSDPSLATVNVRVIRPAALRYLVTFIDPLEETDGRGAMLRAGFGCAFVPPVRSRVISGNDALEDEDRWFGEAEVTPIAGRITDVEVRLEPRPTPPPIAPRRVEAEGAREWCTPSMMLGAGPGETLIVLSSGPDDMPLRPGDRILTVNGTIATPDTWEAIDEELTGTEGSTVRVEALRPDGQRITADISRTSC